MDEWKHNSLLCAKHLFGATTLINSAHEQHCDQVFLTKFLL